MVRGHGQSGGHFCSLRLRQEYPSARPCRPSGAQERQSHVCGQDLGQLSESDRDHFRARHIGYIFQDFNLLQGYTAVENVLLGMTFSRQRPDRQHAQDLLTRVGLSHRDKHRPSEMSIGERQRVAIARALAGKPELILADEPTGSLDPFHALEVVKLLGEACREHGCSLVVVSHDPGVVGGFRFQRGVHGNQPGIFHGAVRRRRRMKLWRIVFINRGAA